MHNSNLDWPPVLLVKVTRQPLTSAYCGSQVSRVHLALHPDGVVCAAWGVPPQQRRFPRVRIVSWKPTRDVPFKLPIRFEGKGDTPFQPLSPMAHGFCPMTRNSTGSICVFSGHGTHSCPTLTPRHTALTRSAWFAV
jgi:hypothetical protein